MNTLPLTSIEDAWNTNVINYDNENYTYEEINEDVIKSVQYLYDYKIL